MAACGTDEPPRRPQSLRRRAESYGPHERQYGEWSLPRRGGSLPVVMLVHGGYWQPEFGPYLERRVAGELRSRGLAVWNIDYRAADAPWPATFEDAATALDFLPSSRFADRLDLGRVAVVGHSAGGHLALWLASRSRLPVGAPGALTGAVGSSVALRLAVGQAPVADLEAAARDRLGGGAAQDLLDGEPADVPARYALGSPATLLPVDDVRLVLVHGAADEVVPVSQSRGYARKAAAAGSPVDVHVVPGGDHFAHLDPGSPALDPVYDALDRL